MNPYFNNSIDLLPTTRARAADIESNFSAVSTGFDGVKTDMDTKATLVSPAFTGSPTAPTLSANDASTRLANMSAVQAAIQANIASGEAAAAAQVALATAQASNAAASAASALNAPGTNATSATSLSVGTGSKTLTIQTGKAYAVGQSVIIARTSDPSGVRMGSVITAYNSGTGLLTVAVSVAVGSGTYSDWTISLGVIANMDDGLRNKVINGGFDLWDYGNSDTYSGSSYRFGAANRWRYYSVTGGTGSATVSRQTFTPGQTDVPGNPTYFLRWNQTVVGTSGLVYMATPIESVATQSGLSTTVSLYLKAATAVSVNVQAIQDFGSGGSTSVSTSLGTADVTTAWQRFVFTATLPSVSGKTIGSGNHLLLALGISSLSTFTVDIADVQLEHGASATPFERRPIATEEMLCQRYLPVTDSAHVNGQAYGTNAAYFHAPYRVPARVAPTGLLLTLALSNYSVTNATFAYTAMTGGALSFGSASTGGGSLTAVPSSSPFVAGNATGLLLSSGAKILWTGAEL